MFGGRTRRTQRKQDWCYSRLKGIQRLCRVAPTTPVSCCTYHACVVLHLPHALLHATRYACTHHKHSSMPPLTHPPTCLTNQVSLTHPTKCGNDGENNRLEETLTRNAKLPPPTLDERCPLPLPRTFLPRT